jgi:hypothetical protein
VEADARVLPPYVTAQLEFYRRTAASARWGYLVTETVALVAAAGVPVAAAAGPSRWVPALLGGIAAVATGLRQLFDFRQNWIQRSVAQESIKARIAAFEMRDEQPATRELVDEVADIALAETDRWRHLADKIPPTPPGKA